MPGTGRPITILHWLFKRVVLALADTVDMRGVKAIGTEEVYTTIFT